MLQRLIGWLKMGFYFYVSDDDHGRDAWHAWESFATENGLDPEEDGPADIFWAGYFAGAFQESLA